MSDSEISELYRLIRDQSDRIADLTVAVARVEERVMARRECPAPGTCIELDRRIKVIETSAAETRGSMRTVVWVAGAVAALVAPLVGVVLKKLGIN